jgi:hypothetical protein
MLNRQLPVANPMMNKAIPMHPRTTPAMASPLPPWPEVLIRDRAIAPVMMAAMLVSGLQHMMMPQMRLAIASPLVLPPSA